MVLGLYREGEADVFDFGGQQNHLHLPLQFVATFLDPILQLRKSIPVFPDCYIHVRPPPLLCARSPQ